MHMISRKSASGQGSCGNMALEYMLSILSICFKCSSAALCSEAGEVVFAMTAMLSMAKKSVNSQLVKSNCRVNAVPLSFFGLT